MVPLIVIVLVLHLVGAVMAIKMVFFRAGWTKEEVVINYDFMSYLNYYLGTMKFKVDSQSLDNPLSKETLRNHE
jgi:hypothetical protein